MNVAMIIDEAQNLSAQLMEQIRLLSNLETDQHKLLQIVLAGQPELRDRLSAPNLRQLRQRILVRYHLPPLTRPETALYIEHRLRTAGSDGRIVFAAAAVDAVFHYSSGVPRLINAVCDNALLAGYVARSMHIDETSIARAIAQLEGSA